MKKDKKIAVLLFSLIGLISVSVGLTVSFYTSGQDLGFQDFNEIGRASCRERV